MWGSRWLSASAASRYALGADGAGAARPGACGEHQIAASRSALGARRSALGARRRGREHTPCPLLSASTLLPKLKPGGILVITVPSLEDEETIGRERINKFGHEYIASDQHHHLYVWGPQQLGHLLKVAGYDVLEAKTRRYTRTGKGDNAFQRGGVEAFWRVAEKENRHPQTFVVARRPG